MKLFALILSTQERLATTDIDNPVLDARLLIAHALGCDRAALLMQGERVLGDDEIKNIDALISRRASREPVHRILGCREFWGLPFGLNEATLEPRPDSETLIEVALSSFRRKPESSAARLRGTRLFCTADAVQLDPAFQRDDERVKSLRLLDLGTGTGCLLLSLLHEWPTATGVGIDKAPRAAQQAALNAQRLGLDDRAVFRIGDWLDGVEEKFDLILCNPPYIPSHDMDGLQPEVRLHDPAAALDGGTDGLDPYRHLIPLLPQFLNANGVVLFEVGIGQAQDVATMMEKASFKNVTITNDLGDIPRCVSGSAS
ncbi:MAG: peptide chain release factor N(5)-glutamine methyltransferase [Bdellovibrionales bacterium]|jgi:release factor glutamine methyltransferase